MSSVWVLGAGQLGKMLQHAGMPLDLDVRPVALDSAETPQPAPGDIVTPEIEHWPTTAATETLANHPNLINRDVFSRLADRLTQKQLMDDLNLATAPWTLVDETLTTEQLYQTLGDRLLLKQRRGGYDGKGQYWLKREAGTELPEDWRQQAIAEQAIAFDEEVSLIGVRDARGNKSFYPLVLNLHINSILTASISPLPRLMSLQNQAESMLGAILDELEYTGVMAMECFRVGDSLLINELAPRVHNSGHWTQSGASISQFESHLRAITGLAAPTPTIKGTTVMVNLLGTERNDRWLEIPTAELYWYGKTVKPGRKVGHINLCFERTDLIAPAMSQLEPLLPPLYKEALTWVKSNT